MTKFGTLGATAIVACMLAGPAMGAQAVPNAGRCAQLDQNGTCRNLGPAHPSAAYQRRAAYRPAERDRAVRTERDFGWNDNRRHDQGFWPAEAAADVVGGTIETGAAIATAPFRTDTYAWDNGDRESYAKRNGFVCTPGTLFRGEDGRRHLCQ